MGQRRSLHNHVVDLRFLGRPGPASNYQLLDEQLRFHSSWNRFLCLGKIIYGRVIDGNPRVIWINRSWTQLSARGTTHARLDVHVGPGGARTLFCGLSGPILIVRRVGGKPPPLDPATLTNSSLSRSPSRRAVLSAEKIATCASNE
jgi:hypothetical protein